MVGLPNERVASSSLASKTACDLPSAEPTLT
jgi:hypothetical protein